MKIKFHCVLLPCKGKILVEVSVSGFRNPLGVQLLLSSEQKDEWSVATSAQSGNLSRQHKKYLYDSLRQTDS